MSYTEFIKEAREYYQMLPYESNEVYKRYNVAIPLPGDEEPFQKTGISGLDALISSICNKTRMKFDAIISDSFTKAINGKIRIIEAKDASDSLLKNKLFRSSESKLAAYVNGNARYFILIDSPERSEEKMNILFVNAGNLSVQVIVNLGEYSRLRLSELYVSNSKSSSTVSILHEVSAAKNSQIEMNALHNENEHTSVLGLCKASAAEGARINANYFYCGGNATKAVSILDSGGHSSRIDVTEFAYGAKAQVFDLNAAVLNTAPYSGANIESGAVLDDSSGCMLKGYAKVSHGAKGADSKIAERGILLSPDAHIDALPDMAIDYSNEVKATHSASTSPIDLESLFYLTSRGLDEEKAKKIIVTAFMAKYISRMEDPNMREIAMSIMLDKLDTKAFGVISDITPKNIWLGEVRKK